MTMQQGFKQFFTPKAYSKVIVDEVDLQTPNKIIDLAIGEGSLIAEAKQKWKYANYYGNDIDAKCCEKLCILYPKVKCFNKDIFLQSTINHIVKTIGKVDLCLGNPPFDLILQNNNTNAILKKYKLHKIYNSNFIPAEVVFILQCLTILSKNGTLALILPDGFFTNRSLKAFRKFLINNHHIQKIIEFPNSIFKQTEAKTHVLILKKSLPTNQNIVLSSTSSDDIIKINKTDAINRMDYSFYKIFNQYKNIGIPLDNFDIQFIRGKPKFLIEDIEDKYILHTTSFINGHLFKNNLKTQDKLLKYADKIAAPGDIIIARVGTYCLGKVGLVKQGYFVATDCVFILRVANIDLRIDIFNKLSSAIGQALIKSISKGVAAKHITLEDIKKIPIINMVTQNVI